MSGSGTRVVGSLTALVIGVMAFTWFGNSYRPESDPQKPKPSVGPTGKKDRRVVIRYDHRHVRSDMLVGWDFGHGHKKGVQTIDKAATAFDISDVVEMGNTVYATAKPKNFSGDEEFRVQIYFDDKPQCPDDFIGGGQTVSCSRKVV